jgi:hypothetical protein
MDMRSFRWGPSGNFGAKRALELGSPDRTLGHPEGGADATGAGTDSQPTARGGVSNAGVEGAHGRRDENQGGREIVAAERAPAQSSKARSLRPANSDAAPGRPGQLR